MSHWWISDSNNPAKDTLLLQIVLSQLVEKMQEVPLVA
jgi:hypothetical protein